jgi:hypothetical protein
MDRYEALLYKNANESLNPTEKDELNHLRQKADLLTLRKAHAAALLRWRGYQLPPAANL